MTRPTPVRIALAAGVALVGFVVTPILSGPITGSASASTVHPVSSAAAGSRGPFVGTVAKHNPAVSLDWAGYAVTGPAVTTVSGSWIQPSATCSIKKANQSAFWVGIDGFAPTDATVQQVGTDADCSKGTRKAPSMASYYAWFEMYPGPLVVLSTSTYPVAPGDAMTASVTQVGAGYQLVLTDAGRWTFSTIQAVSTTPLDASGEWIVEAPTTCKNSKCKPIALTDFGSAAFTGATANGQPVGAPGFTRQQITMSKNKKGTIVKAATSALTAGGTAFNVTWVGN